MKLNRKEMPFIMDCGNESEDRKVSHMSNPDEEIRVFPISIVFFRFSFLFQELMRCKASPVVRVCRKPNLIYEYSY